MAGGDAQMDQDPTKSGPSAPPTGGLAKRAGLRRHLGCEWLVRRRAAISWDRRHQLEIREPLGPRGLKELRQPVKFGAWAGGRGHRTLGGGPKTALFMLRLQMPALRCRPSQQGSVSSRRGRPRIACRILRNSPNKHRRSRTAPRQQPPRHSSLCSTVGWTPRDWTS